MTLPSAPKANGVHSDQKNMTTEGYRPVMTMEKPSYLALVDTLKHVNITDLLWFKQWISKL